MIDGSSNDLELEALVAHIYVVGGRAIGSVPPGSISMLAPKRAPKPRQEETFFMLLVPHGNVRVLARDYQAMAEQAGELYFKTMGSITGGLRESLTALNQQILEQQRTMMQPLRISLLCAVMQGQELYVARCGPMVAYFRTGDRISSFPGNRTTEGLAVSPPLGAVMEPRVELTRYELTPDSILVLADGGFASARDDEIRRALITPSDIGTLLEPLRNLLKAPLGHATVIQFVTEDTPTPDLPPSSKLPMPAPASAEPATGIEAAPALSDRNTSSRRALKAVAKTLTDVADTTTRVGDTIFADVAATPEDSRNPLLSNLLVLFAIVIPLVIVVVVVGLALSQGGDTAFETCRVQVLALQDAARQLNPAPGAPLNDEAANRARDQWELLIQETNACEKHKPGDEEMRLAAGEAQNELDRFDLVRRQDVTPLHRFDAEAELRGPISGTWVTMYTLDRTQDAIYQDVLSSDGKTLASVGTTPVIFEGQNIRGDNINELIDLEWMERGGLPGGVGNVPIVLDENGLLIWYNETFNDIDAMQLIVPPTWVRPTALAVWQVNLYILDAEGRQVWRFRPSDGVYSEQPEEYFFGEVRPDLTTAIDLGIDEDGSLYILFSNGVVRKYLGGAEVEFDLYNLPRGALTVGTSLFVDNNPISRGLVVTDTSTGTLYMTTLGGTVSVGYRPLNELTAFNGISGALVNADLGNIYVLSGDFLYYMPRQ